MLNKFLFIILALFTLQAGFAAPDAISDKWVDLTHNFSKETIYWPTAEPFELQKVFEGVTPSGYFYSAFQFKGAEHGGTHLDAPYHFAKSGKTVENIELDQLIGPAIVIDVSQSALKDPDYQITVEDLKNWEKLHGNIPKNSIILLYTGYSAFWPDKEKYLGTTETGEEGVAKLHFPGLSPTAASWLAKRGIKAIGIDTASIDYGQSKTFKSHRILARNNIPIFENIANLNVLPEKGAEIIALPMKIKEGSGAPLRIIAKLPKPLASKANGTEEANNKEEKK
ncbi:MAG: cyclase [Legionellales bacterium]|nr:cyclase [Legionellales bacterium]|tara:strand:+ start:1988 stop:2833 length:846 start_codon:yes stop_codon:yes gene_type:complete